MADSEQNREDGDGSQKPKGQVTTAAIMENFEAQASDEIHEHGQNSGKEDSSKLTQKYIALQDMLNRTIQMQQEAKTEFGKLLKAKQVETTSEKAVKRIDQSKPRITSIVNMPAEKEQTTQANNSNMADQIKEAIRIEVVNKNNSTKRDYKLGPQVKLEHFYEFFKSELRTNDLLYVIDEKIAPPKGTNDQIKEKHLHSVRDILINQIDQTYHSKILSIQDPKQILNVLKEFKRCETNLTSVSIRRQLHSMEYKENKSAMKFWDRFEELIRSYENIPDSTTLSDEEKRDAFYNAILPVFPEVQTLDFMLKNQTGKGLTYNGLKSFIVEAEANRANATTSKKTVSVFSAARSKRWVNKRCYECDDYGHLQKDCPRKGRGLKKCYECNKFGRLLAKA
ncbi:uncharacterized protein [Temnothorax longispinosus]|uniref:uncharacterized protein n=1 Tax=Temnothorax longispinosus TaxID=300112 RepID=UPI003A98D9B8